MNIENMRNTQYISLENNIKTAASLVKLFPASDLTSYKDGGTGWTATQVLCHLRDFELVFLERATLTVTQEMPDLPFPNPDELAEARRYHEENAADVVAQWQANRARLLTFFKERQESDWERPAMHPKRGKLTLNDQLYLAPQHDTIHFEQLSRVLAEKK